MRRSRKILLLVASALLLIACIRVGYVWFWFDAQGVAHRLRAQRDLWMYKHFGDAWDRKARELGGRHAVDCGRVTLHEDPINASNCAMAAFQRHRPFRVRYDLRGIDSNVSAGLVYTPRGKLYEVDWDGDPYGGGGFSPERQQVGTALCPQPWQIRINARDRVTCYAASQTNAPNIMSPNWEPY